MKLVGIFAGDVQADMDHGKTGKKEEDEVIRADEQPGPPTDELLLAAVGNYAGYLARKSEANSSVVACCNQELAQQKEVEISVELERGGPPSAVFNA